MPESIVFFRHPVPPTNYHKNMSFETEQEQRRRSREAVESRGETREAREGGKDALLEQAAALERADILQKEIKTSKNQMQNILLHIQQVTTAIAALRQQLSLSAASGDPSSVKQDKEKVEELKEKIAGYQQELFSMREDLVREQMSALRSEGFVSGASELEERAREMVEKMIGNKKWEIGNEK